MNIYNSESNKFGEKFEKLVSIYESGSPVCCPQCNAFNSCKLLSLFSSSASSKTACASSGGTS